MLKGLIAASILLVSAENAAAWQQSTDNTVEIPNQTIKFNDHDIHEIISVQFNEKHSFKLGGDIKANKDFMSEDRNEGIIMAKYKFSF